MKRALLRSFVALLVVAGVLLALAPSLQTAPKPGSGGAALTQQGMDDWLTSSPAARWTLTVAKGLPLLLGIAFLIQELLRADRERGRRTGAGGLPGAPPLLGGGPLAVATPLQAFSLGLLFPLGVQVTAVALLTPRDGLPAAGLPLEQGIAVAVAGLLPPALIVVLRRRRLGGDSLPSVRTGLVEGLRYGCMAILLVLPVGALWALALLQRGAALEVQEVVEVFAKEGSTFRPWLVALFGAFVAPFTEEAVFRGLLYPALRRAMPGGAFGAAVLVSLLFAAIHNSLTAFVPLFALAMLLAGVMERTRSLLACVVVHAIHNATSLVPMMVRTLGGSGS